MIIRDKNEGKIHFMMRIVWRNIKKIKCYFSYIKFYVFCPKLNPSKKEDVITISFTTYPARVKWLPVVVGSLLRQTLQPDRIVLYLSSNQFDNLNNPIFKRIQKQGVEIKVKDDDLRSHKKYIYAMEEYPEDIIITVDDDIVYNKNLIKSLYESYKRHPNSISATRVHCMKFDNNHQILPYKQWDKVVKNIVDVESFELVATGCGGVLYPPKSLAEGYNNIDVIKETCIFADDLWLKIMELVKRTPVVLVSNKNNKLTHVWNTECEGLALNNVGNVGNDEQLKKICSRLNIDLYKLSRG